MQKRRQGEWHALKKEEKRNNETGFHNDLTDCTNSEIIVKADFVPISEMKKSTGRLVGYFYRINEDKSNQKTS